MNTKYRSGMNIGSASLVLIFAVLCLTLFATLTLISAKNEMKLTNKYAQSVARYYAADSQAEQNLQCIENILSAASKTSVNKAAFIKEECSKYNLAYMQKNNKIYIIFNENINTTQTLHVVVQVSSINSKLYEIIQWKKINFNEVNIDENINVYK